MRAVRRLWADRSLQTQVTLLSAAGAAVVGLGAMLVIPDADGATAAQVEIFRLRLALVLLLTCGVCTALLVTGLRRLLSPLDTLREGMTRIIEGHVDAISPGPAPNPDTVLVRRTFDRMVEQFRAEKDAHQHAQKILAARNRTVDRLLEFSQTIQGAGKAEQIYEGLCHFLQAELGLAGLTILSNAPDALPPTQVRACYPADLMKPECAIGEMETGLCPCLRQNLPRQFKPDSPVRCAIEQTLRLDRSHPAYCVPFNVGGKTQVLAHMLLAPGESWTDERKQLAQAYVNTTHAALTTLHLLAEAEKQSMTDVLTGLYNRRSMESLLEREVALSERHGHALTVVMIDMDKFKEVNDEYGHAAGDHMLRSFADCVRITLRKTDLAFRYGGDEFVIALPQTPILQAQAVVQKLRQAFGAVDFSHAIAHLEHQPTLSIGVAERSKATNVLTLQNLLAAADQALYDAKNSNRNCIKLYSPPQAA